MHALLFNILILETINKIKKDKLPNYASDMYIKLVI